MENKRIAVLPIVETPENWEGEIHAGYALEYAPEGYVSVYSVEDFVSAGDKVYLFPKQKPGKRGHREKTTYEVLCELANEAVSRGYVIEVAFVTN